MEPSAELCRAQVAHHHNVATSAQLANVRQIAAAAEKAWALEAILAEKRDARRAQARRTTDATMAGGWPRPALVDESLLSENPDRGHAHA
jgi:hypothetical protein